MSTLNSFVASAAILVGGLFLGACGSQGTDVKTTTPSSMLGTDSAAAKMGGLPLDTASLRTTPAIGAAADSTRLGTGQ